MDDTAGADSTEPTLTDPTVEAPESGTSDDAGEEGNPPAGPTLDLDEYGEHLVSIVVDGEEQLVPLQELRASGMRQADYTRKTQELAEKEKHVAALANLEAAFEEDPEGVVRSLAQAIGLDLGSTSTSDAGDEPDPFEDMDPVERKVAELEAELEAIKGREAQEERARQAAAIDAEIDATLQQYNDEVTTGDEILEFALARGIPDVEAAYLALVKHKELTAPVQQDTRRAAKTQAPPVEGGTKRAAGVVGGNRLPTVAEAFAMAQQQLS